MYTPVNYLFVLVTVLFLNSACGGSSDSDSSASTVGSATPSFVADTKNGANLKATLTNFNFKPENLGQASTSQQEGYLELVLNGNVHSRLYGSWLYLSKTQLKDGDNEAYFNLKDTNHQTIGSSSKITYHFHESSDGHSHGKPVQRLNSSGNMSHSHGMVMVQEGQAVPSISIDMTKDSVSGYNLKFSLENYTLTPENVNLENVFGEGHMHLYINDEKITRLYEPWHHISSLSTGENKVRVELSANDHSVYSYQGNTIDATTMVTVP